MSWKHALCLSLTLSAVPLHAQEVDIEEPEECKDSPFLGRMTGCKMSECSSKEFDSIALLAGGWDDATGDYRRRELEGQVEHRYYWCPAKLSELQILRNAEAALKKAGWDILAFEKPDGSVGIVAARSGGKWIALQTGNAGDQPLYEQWTVVEQEMEQEMTADAGALAAAIEADGRVAIHGIRFATGSARIEASSEPVLAEVVKLLQAHPDWKLRVEGHTDATGTAEGNRKLSADRAAAVVAWLGERGIDRARLTPAGLGDTKPLDSNETEAGRARNRRVELVKL